MAARDNGIDTIRGLAIVIMFYAHLLPYYIEIESISFFERLVCSTAAPIFLFLLGYNFSPGKTKKHNIYRGSIILSLAAITDSLVYKINPFYSFDVLYLIALGIYLLVFTCKLTTKFRLSIILGIVLVSFLYAETGVYEFNLLEPQLGEVYHTSQGLQNLLFNGWFPVFPWILFPLLGHLERETKFSLAINHYLLATLFIIFSISLTFRIPPFRDFSVEIFYPASINFICFGIAVALLLIKFKTNLNGLMASVLSQFGRLSLFLYVFHLILYQLLMPKILHIEFNRIFVFSFMLMILLGITYLMNIVKIKFPQYLKFTVLTIILGR